MLTLAPAKAGLLTGRSAGKRPSGLRERGRIVAQTRNSAANAQPQRIAGGFVQLASASKNAAEQRPGE